MTLERNRHRKFKRDTATAALANPYAGTITLTFSNLRGIVALDDLALISQGAAASVSALIKAVSIAGNVLTAEAQVSGAGNAAFPEAGGIDLSTVTAYATAYGY